jgi:DNA-binding XRE family transcriptional regulator
MDKLKYEPVLHDQPAFLDKANKRKGFKEVYERLDEEYAIIREILSARSKSGLTQEAVAEIMGTTKSAISRLESGNKHSPSLQTLIKYARAIGYRLQIKLVRSR